MPKRMRFVLAAFLVAPAGASAQPTLRCTAPAASRLAAPRQGWEVVSVKTMLLA
jgi:hypothetical protein